MAGVVFGVIAGFVIGVWTIAGVGELGLLGFIGLTVSSTKGEFVQPINRLQPKMRNPLCPFRHLQKFCADDFFSALTND